MQDSSGVSLWALTLFLAVVSLGGFYLTTVERPKGMQPAVVHSSEILEDQKSAGLYSNYRKGLHDYLEVHYEDQWQVVKCSIKGWKQQSLYFRHNLSAVAEGCELERSAKINVTKR